MVKKNCEGERHRHTYMSLLNKGSKLKSIPRRVLNIMQVLRSWICDLTDYNLDLVQHGWDTLCGLKLENRGPTL